MILTVHDELLFEADRELADEIAALVRERMERAVELHPFATLVALLAGAELLGVLGAMARVIGLLAYVLLAGIGIVGAYALRESTAAAGAVLAGALVLAALGILWAAFDRHRRTLHDRLAGTIVVRLV